MIGAGDNNLIVFPLDSWYIATKVAVKKCGRGLSKPVVLKVVDIDPHGSIGQSKGLINSHGIEWGSLNGQGANE